VKKQTETTEGRRTRIKIEIDKNIRTGQKIKKSERGRN
jgi:hypothetical protein